MIAKHAGDRLAAHGINILPSTPVEHNGEVYVLTKLVDCTPHEDLEDLLRAQPSAELMQRVDTIWTGLWPMALKKS